MHDDSPEQIRREFLEELHRRAVEDYKGKIHKAFIAWYVEAEFGNVQWELTDDSADGGIDAVVWLPNDFPSVAILQSKFTTHVDKSALNAAAYADFERVAEAFRYGEESLNEFLAKPRADLGSIYRRAHKKLGEAGGWAQRKKAFRLITTHSRSRKEEFDLIPENNFVYAKEIEALYRQYRRTKSPPAKTLILHAGRRVLPYRDSVRGVHSLLFNARVSDFRAYLEDCSVARLVAGNIRLNLGKKIGRMIRATYEEKPHDFWYFHNGITMICDKMTHASGRVTIYRPSVINGAQTLFAISASDTKRNGALVTTRVIVRHKAQEVAPEDDRWIQDVIRYVNTQNKVDPSDFRSNDAQQIELQRLFRVEKVFYERKRGEWREHRNEPQYQGFTAFSLKSLGNVLTDVSERDGAGVLLVKSGVEKVFSDENYGEQFPIRSLIAKRFERIFLAYALYRILNELGYADMKQWKRQRHAFWNCLWVLHRGVTSVDHFHSKATVRSIRETLWELDYGSGPRYSAAKSAARKLTRAAWKAWRKGRRKDVERWTANNFFKNEYGNKCLMRYAFPEVRRELRKLGIAMCGQ